MAGGDDELCRALVDACGAAGYPAEAIDDQEIGGIPGPGRRQRSGSASARVLTIWEVPVLEAAWAQRLEWRARRTGPVIALAGFADRSVVARARGAGAVACLELPCDLDDLVDAVDRAVDSDPAGLLADPGPGRGPARAAAPASQCSTPSQPGRPLSMVRSGAVAYNSSEWQVISGKWQVMSRPTVSKKAVAVESGSRRAAPERLATPHPPLVTLKDLTRQIQRSSGFPEVVARAQERAECDDRRRLGLGFGAHGRRAGAACTHDAGDPDRARRRRGRLPR